MEDQEATFTESDIVLDDPSFRLYKDSRIERFACRDVVGAGFDAATGVNSRDVIIDADTGVWARLYLPDLAAAENGQPLLPVLVFFHGGAFVLDSADSSRYHTFVNSLASKARVLVISVDYRRAPEHPIPAAYDDSWEALRWVLSAGRRDDPWLAEHGDLSRIFLAGDSAGGNIAHNVAIQAGVRGADSLEGGHIEGVILLHPAFGGREQIDGEPSYPWEFGRKLWSVICPSSRAGMDDPVMNPTAPGAPSLALLGCERLLVCLAENDPLRARGKWYYDAVAASGWHGRAECFETEGEEHVFFVKNPRAEIMAEFMDCIISFINGTGSGERVNGSPEVK